MTDEQIATALELADTDALADEILKRADNGVIAMNSDKSDNIVGVKRYWRGNPYICKGLAIEAACELATAVERFEDEPDKDEDGYP